MQTRLRKKVYGVIVALALFLGTALLGFAHKAPSAQDMEILAAAVQGYDVSDICAGNDGDLHFGTHCPACHIGDGAEVPGPAGIVRDADLRLIIRIVAGPRSEALRSAFDPAHGVRAPPVLTDIIVG